MLVVSELKSGGEGQRVDRQLTNIHMKVVFTKYEIL